VDGDKARRVPVRVQRLSVDHALLAADDGKLQSVVVSGASMLHDGALVRVVP
jgi:hypothetical protein